MLPDDRHLYSSRILVLYPDVGHGAYARNCLETLGLVAEGVTSATELRARLAEPMADLLVIDGDNAAAESVLALAKGHSATMLVPVLAVCSDDGRARAMMAAGCDDAVLRSAGPRGLLAVTEALLEQRDLRRRLGATVVGGERAYRERLRTGICRYLSPRLADRIMADADAGDPGAHRQTYRTRAAVMFADMRGFTTMAERLGPGDTLKVLNEYFAMLTDIAFRHDGTVFNMSGDSLMIGYGVPVEQQDSTPRAVRTAAEMLAGFRDLAAGWRERHNVHVGLGIGINDGEVLAGDVGSSQFMSYTMIGDTVNVAARLSQRARAGEVLFSGSVKRALDERGFDVGAVPLPPLTLRGRSGPLDIFCVPIEERVLTDV